MKKNVYLFFILSLILLIGCDFKNCDLIVVNKTQENIYFYVHPYKSSHFWSHNIALMEYMQKEYESTSKDDYYYYDFENNHFGLKANSEKRDCITNTNFNLFSEDKGGLTLLAYKREVLEKKNAIDTLIPKDVFKRIDLTHKELLENNFRIVIE